MTSASHSAQPDSAVSALRHCFGFELANVGCAGVYTDRGRTYYDKAEYDRAIADLSRAIELDPG
jgi:tetratricopeptide (TPR) repeat protein